MSRAGTVLTQPSMVADELRRQADEFVDLVSLMPKIGRDPGERAVRIARAPIPSYGAQIPAEEVVRD